MDYSQSSGMPNYLHSGRIILCSCVSVWHPGWTNLGWEAAIKFYLEEILGKEECEGRKGEDGMESWEGGEDGGREEESLIFHYCGSFCHAGYYDNLN